MTVDSLHEALDTGRPFEIQMADGHAYQVPHRDFLAFTRKRTAVMVALDNGRTQILPLITMTGITYAPEPEAHKDA
jgi:hypothetical protein